MGSSKRVSWMNLHGRMQPQRDTLISSVNFTSVNIRPTYTHASHTRLVGPPLPAQRASTPAGSGMEYALCLPKSDDDLWDGWHVIGGDE